MKATRYQNKDKWDENSTDLDVEIRNVPAWREFHFIIPTGGPERGAQYRVRIDTGDFDALIQAMMKLSPSKTCDAFNKALKKQLRTPNTK